MPTTPPGDEPVGSLGEEAVKLLGALGDWARDQRSDPGADADPAPDPAPASAPDPAPDLGGDLGADLAAAAAGLLGRASAAARQVGEHLDTGATECTWCPVCRTVHVLRTTSPEVREQLVVAATALLQVGTGLLASLQAGPPGAGDADGSAGHDGGRARRTRVEHIDLTDGPVDPVARDAVDDPDEWES